MKILLSPFYLGAVQVLRDQIWALSRPPPLPLVIKSDILAYPPPPPLFDHMIHFDMIRFGPPL